MADQADQADPNQPIALPNPPIHENINPRPNLQQEENVNPDMPNWNNQPLRQFFVPSAYEHSLAINFKRLGNVNFELKPSIMNLLPSFMVESMKVL